MGYFKGLALLLIGLKLTGNLDSTSWFVVLIPTLIVAIASVLALAAIAND